MQTLQCLFASWISKQVRRAVSLESRFAPRNSTPRRKRRLACRRTSGAWPFANFCASGFIFGAECLHLDWTSNANTLRLKQLIRALLCQSNLLWPLCALPSWPIKRVSRERMRRFPTCARSQVRLEAKRAFVREEAGAKKEKKAQQTVACERARESKQTMEARNERGAAWPPLGACRRQLVGLAFECCHLRRCLSAWREFWGPREC